MNVLAAAEGSSLDSPVAPRFERAVWYLIVDTESAKREVYQNICPHDRCTILLAASRHHISTVVAGGVTSSTARLMRSLNLHLAIASKMTVHQAVDKLKDRSLVIADLSHYNQFMNRIPMLRGTPMVRKDVLQPAKLFERSTPYGRHHLQQYGGRGH
jgi:predicted Fe-Mo cluster-binding NifX family protein